MKLAALLAPTLMIVALTTSACSSYQKPAPSAATVSGPDTCGAAALLAAVNQPASIIPTNLSALRIVDVQQPQPSVETPTRVTVVNDIQEQKVREIRCG